MSTTSLIVEFLVIGFFPFLAILFIILGKLKIYNFCFLINFESTIPLIIPALIILIYTLGAIFHRITQLFNTNTFSFLLKFGLIRNLSGQISPTNLNQWWFNYCIVYEYGSENLIKRLEYEESLVRIFRSGIITIPIFGIIFGLWLYEAGYPDGKWMFIFLGLLLSLTSSIAYIIQRRSMRQKFTFASDLIKNKYMKDKGIKNVTTQA